MALRARYIGAPLLARGLLLAGVSVTIPAPEKQEIWAAVQTARAEADIVLIDAMLAVQVEPQLEQLLDQHPLPPVLRIGSLETIGQPAEETVAFARRELGVT